MIPRPTSIHRRPGGWYVIMQSTDRRGTYESIRYVPDPTRVLR